MGLTMGHLKQYIAIRIDESDNRNRVVIDS